MYDINKVIDGLQPKDAEDIIILFDKHDYSELLECVNRIINKEERSFLETGEERISTELYLFREYLDNMEEQDNDVYDFLELREDYEIP